MTSGAHECAPYSGTGDALFIAPEHNFVGAPFMAPWQQLDTVH